MKTRKAKIYASVEEYSTRLICNQVYRGDGFYRAGKIYVVTYIEVEAGAMTITASTINKDIEFTYSPDIVFDLYTPSRHVESIDHTPLGEKVH